MSGTLKKIKKSRMQYKQVIVKSPKHDMGN